MNRYYIKVTPKEFNDLKTAEKSKLHLKNNHRTLNIGDKFIIKEHDGTKYTGNILHKVIESVENKRKYTLVLLEQN